MSTAVVASSPSPCYVPSTPEYYPINYDKPDCGPEVPYVSPPFSPISPHLPDFDSPYYLAHEDGPGFYPPFFAVTPTSPLAGANGQTEDDEVTSDDEEYPVRRAMFQSPSPFKQARSASPVPSSLDEY